MSGLGSLNTDQRKDLERFMAEGLTTLQQIDDLREGLKDTTKAYAEKFEIKPAELTTALRTVFSDSFADKKEAMGVVEEIIAVTGYDGTRTYDQN